MRPTGPTRARCPPLANHLDPDALDALFEPRPEGPPRSGGHVSFVYAGYRVTVDNGEYLTVRPLDSWDRMDATPTA